MALKNEFLISCPEKREILGQHCVYTEREAAARHGRRRAEGTESGETGVDSRLRRGDRKEGKTSVLSWAINPPGSQPPTSPARPASGCRLPTPTPGLCGPLGLPAGAEASGPCAAEAGPGHCKLHGCPVGQAGAPRN